MGDMPLNYMKNRIRSKTWSYLAASLGILLVVVLLLRAKPKAQRKEESGD